MKRLAILLAVMFVGCSGVESVVTVRGTLVSDSSWWDGRVTVKLCNGLLVSHDKDSVRLLDCE